MSRYDFLDKAAIYEALNNLRNAFLAAKDGHEVNEIIKGILTNDERMKIGRRIQVAQMLQAGFIHDEIMSVLNVGSSTITLVSKHISRNPKAFELINQREDRVEQEYGQKSKVKVGGSLQVFKPTKQTGFKRSDVRRNK